MNSVVSTEFIYFLEFKGFIMRYKNKEIRSMYSVSFVAYIVGIVLTILAFILLGCGFFFGARKLNDQMHLDEAMERPGNSASRVVYFDIVEEPIKVGKDSHDTYYMVTDGAEYRLVVLKDDDLSKIKKELEKSVPFRAYGMTRYIVDNDTNEEIAKKASDVLGQQVTVYNMDKYFGEVCFTYFKLSYRGVLFHGYLVNFIFGIMFLIIGGFMFLGMRLELKSTRTVKSLSGITADDIDNEASKPDSKFMGLNVILSPDMLIGLTYNSSQYDCNQQVALRHNEIVRVYAYHKNVIPVASGTPKDRYIIEAEAIDGNRYVISNTGNEYISQYSRMESAAEIFQCIREQNPGVIFEPSDAKYQTYRFSYVVEREEYEEEEYEEEEHEEVEHELSPEALSDDVREALCDTFSHGEIIKNFEDKDAIFSLKMQFVDNTNFVDITTGYFGDRESEVAPKFYEYLKKEINISWDSYYDGDEYSLRFSAADDTI